jgi:heme-degrading monooxygenase HmoA
MTKSNVILRKWTGRIRSADQEEYGTYVARTGADDYSHTPGNLGFQILMRPLGDGTSEVITLSWWESMNAVQRFAGDKPEFARYYPDDDRFLLDRPILVEHYQVIASCITLSIPPAISAPSGS